MSTLALACWFIDWRKLRAISVTFFLALPFIEVPFEWLGTLALTLLVHFGRWWTWCFALFLAFSSPWITNVWRQTLALAVSLIQRFAAAAFLFSWTFTATLVLCLDKRILTFYLALTFTGGYVADFWTDTLQITGWRWSDDYSSWKLKKTVNITEENSWCKAYNGYV